MKLSRSVQLVIGVCAATAFLAGCSGSGSTLRTTSSAPAGSVRQPGSSFVHAGVPFATRAAGPQQGNPSISPTYPTTDVLLFEGDSQSNQVAIYLASQLASNPAPINAITDGILCPYGMVLDTHGRLYVASNCGRSTITEYPRGRKHPTVTITDGISNPLGLAMDKNGVLYVSNYPASITEYPFHSTSPSTTITGGGMIDPFGLALDSSGNLYIADFGAVQVFEIKAGTTTVIPLNLQDLSEPLGVAFDNLGNLWVTDGAGDKVNVYPPGSTTPSQSFNAGYTFPYAISINARGKAVISNVSSPPVVNAYKPGQYTSYATLTNGIQSPTGLLLKRP
jgi:sugar lactone lactonase YvrE